MSIWNIFLALLAGAGVGQLSLILDNGVDLGAADAHTTWFVGPLHVPTLIAGVLAVVGMLIGWGFSMVSGEWVAAAFIALLGGLVWAWVASYFLPVLNAGLALLGLSVPWYSAADQAVEGEGG